MLLGKRREPSRTEKKESPQGETKKAEALAGGKIQNLKTNGGGRFRQRGWYFG